MTVIIVCAALCYCVFLPVFKLLNTKKPPVAIAAKGLATACFAVIALVAALQGGGRLWMCVAALFFCALADILLEGNFLLGMGMFICAHMWYILWFLSRAGLSALHAAAALALGLLVFLMFRRWRERIGSRLPPFVAYAAVLCVMGACGIACSREASLAGALTAVGAGLFYLSDAMVCRQTIMPASRLFSAVTMIVYETAQLMFALSAASIAGMI